MRTHPDIDLMTVACGRLAATYTFLAVYSNIIIINVCECCVKLYSDVNAMDIYHSNKYLDYVCVLYYI